MDVRIGLVYSPRDLEVELADDTDVDSFRAQVDEAFAGDSVLWLTDKRGNRTAVHASKITYVQVGSGEHGRIGFGT